LTPGNIYTFTYTVAPTAPCVGNDVSTFTITIIDCSAGTPPTAVFTASQTTICAGECITFTDNSTPGDITDWGWDFGGGAIPNNAIGQNPGSICFNTAGTYTVTLGVVNPAGTDDATVTITVNALPSVTANAAPASTICAGDPVTLSGGGATSYVWTGGVTNGVAFNPASTGTYTVTGTDANGCENTANITVTVDICEPMIAGFSYNDNICAGDCITLTDTTTGVPIAWNWDFGGGATPNTSTDQNPVVCFTSPGTFNIQLTTTDAGGNNSSTTNSISVFGLPTVTAQLDTIVDIGHEVILDATGSGSGTYLWTPDEGDIACDTCANTTAYPLVNTDFIVYYTDVNGCMAQDTVFVIVNFIEGIGVPQAFSPNGDGHNDVLFVKGFGIIQMKFSVYNRYGQQVFETTDQNIGWDGTFKGRDENPGVFVWVLEYTLIDNISSGVISGNTTLIR
jgi:gliding motility-associated-like protein